MANSDSSVLQETILRAMDAVVTQRNNELKLDKTVTAIIKKNVGTRNNRPLYEVEYEGGRLVATAQNSTDSYVPNTSVYVLVPQGNFSNEKIIIGRASSIDTDRSASVVAAAANSYSIIGSNLIKSTSTTKVKDIQYGLHSFHNAADESNTGHSTNHRFQILYNSKNNSGKKITFNDSNLNIYKEQATALMLKAEFQTNLDVNQKRQPGARYGLIFNFSFDNLNKGFGETNGEIFDAIASAVMGKVIKVNSSTSSDQKLSNYKIVNNFSDEVISYYIEYVKMIADNYEIIDKKDKINRELVDNLITAYLALLNNLYTIAKANRQTEYTQWRNEKVGQPSKKIESFMLTSDMMLGNPLGFSQWNTQYSVFSIDMNTFDHLDSIYFFKEGFIENTEAENNWPIGEGGNPDIFVKNIQIYAMKPLEAQSGDYSLKVEPYKDNDFVLSSANESTTVTAVVMRMLSEDLTHSDRTSYYWFKENSSIINSSSDGYNYLAGPGWKEIGYRKESKYLFRTTLDENLAYKNNYKCVAIYSPASDDEIILSVSFTIYNENAALKVKLESDIGTEFTFNAGIPTIKVLIQEKDKNDYKEIDFDTNTDTENAEYTYRYIWAITEDNGQKIFLTDSVEEKNQNFLLVRRQSSLLDRISYYALSGTNVISVDNSYSATRIKYPVYATSRGFTVNCYIQRAKIVSRKIQKYFDVGSAQLEFINKDEDLNMSAFHIEIENGDQVFQYDEYGNSPTATKLKQPLEIQPIKAKLINRSGLEIEGSNYLVEWIFPIENTLLISKEALVENSVSQLVQSYWGRECNFSIQNIYNPDFYNNQITCHISFGNNDLYKDTNFYFGKVGGNGTNGTDVIAKIEYAKEDAINRLHSEPLTLYVQKGITEYTTSNGENRTISNGAKFNIDKVSTQEDSITLQTSQNLVNTSSSSTLQLKLYQKNEEIDASKYAAGYPKWNLAGNSNGTSNTQSKYFNLTSTSLTWGYSFGNNNPYRLQNIKAEVKLKTGETYYAYFSLPIIEYESGQNLNTKLHRETIAIDKATYLNEIVYNADGRNPIYNHNAGLKLINLPKGVTITWTAKGGFNLDKDGNAKEDTPSISLIKSKNNETRWSSYTTSVINSGTAMTYVLPADNYTGRVTNNRIEAVVKKDSKIIATVYAPINMTLNTFGLASINAWDGNSITIDEDNGAVLAPQIGAGEKDSNNRFTGIVMGKTETYTGGAKKEKQIGLFGYADGLQSIFLDSETGNATFGLPDPVIDPNDSTRKVYNNTNRVVTDNYNEGRIELRPGGESKIGGWRLGRRSLYYTSSPSSTEVLIDPLTQHSYINRYLYSYSGEIGPAYKGDIGTPGNKQYATHHEKDIKSEDAGLLLSANPAYISIKGKKLGQMDIDNGLNSQLAVGDSLEIQLDPQTPTLFTIFRHNSSTRTKNPGKRVYLAGINDRGELLANGVGREDGSGTGTKSGNIVLKAFKDTIDQESGSYVGSVFEAGSGLASTRTFFQIFREKANPLNTSAQVYMTGGQVTSSGEFIGTTSRGDEYLRPISIHGNSIGLFARTGNPNEIIGYDENDDPITAGYNWTSTDANIQISTNSAQIQLGSNTGLNLYRNATSTSINSLKTAGLFNIKVGTSGDSNLTIDAGATTATIGSATINSSGDTKITTKNITITNNGTTINNAGATTINNANTITINADNNVNLYRKYNNNYVTYGTRLLLQDNQVELGIPEYTQTINNISTVTRKSLITMSATGANSWDSLGSIELTAIKPASQIILNIDEDSSGKTGSVGSRNATNTQILLQAGTHTRLGLTSDNNYWAGSSGYPFDLYMGNSGRIYVKTDHPNASDETLVNTLVTDLNIQTRKGVSITGNLTEVNNGEIITSPDYGLIVTKGIQTKSAANLISFGSTNFSGSSGSITCNLNNITTLKQAIDTLAARIAQVADAFNKHTHTFSTSSSETVYWTAPTHTVLTSAKVSATKRSLSATGLGTTESAASFGNEGSLTGTITTGNTSWNESSTYVSDLGTTKSMLGGVDISLSGTTGTVGGESYSKNVDLTVNQTLGVPEDQKIKDNNF